MKLLFFAVLCMAATALIAEKKPYDRYQSIVDRQMFGAPPPDFDPMKMPSEVSKTSQKELTKEQEKLQSSVHFSVINVASDGTPVVGFTDNSNPKAPVHQYIKVGQESGGWKVLSANAAEATMTIQKDGVELTLKLGDNSGKSAGGGAPTPAVAAASAANAPGVGAAFRSGLLGGTLRNRRAMREKRLQEQQEAEKKAREQEREQERAQREQEREEQRQQLLAIQEELKRQREEKAAKSTEQNEVQADANNNAE